MSVWFVLLGVALIHWPAMMSPGPNFIVVTQAAATHSRHTALATALGIALGALVWSGGAMLGLSLVFERAVWLYGLVRLLGGVYLLYLGVKMWRHAATPLRAAQPAAASPAQTHFWRGFLTNFTNPNSLIFFGSIFVSVFSPATPAWVRAAAVGIITIDALVWHTGLALAFSTRGVQRIYGRIKKRLDRAVGVLLAYLGVRLILLSQR